MVITKIAAILPPNLAAIRPAIELKTQGIRFICNHLRKLMKWHTIKLTNTSGKRML